MGFLHTNGRADRGRARFPRPAQDDEGSGRSAGENTFAAAQFVYFAARFAGAFFVSSAFIVPNGTERPFFVPIPAAAIDFRQSLCYI